MRMEGGYHGMTMQKCSDNAERKEYAKATYSEREGQGECREGTWKKGMDVCAVYDGAQER